MGKIKSAIVLALITILIAGLCFMCAAAFPHGSEKIDMFNNFIAMTEKDSKLGNSLPEGYTTSNGRTYIGGGYTAVYYPEGVISAQEYTDNLAGLKDVLDNTDATDKSYADKQKAVTEYEERYVCYPDEKGNIYLDKEEVYNDEGTAVSEEFKANFEGAYAQLRARLEGMHLSGSAVSVRDDYTLQVTMPTYEGTPSTLAYVFTQFASTGEFSMGYGSDATTATRLTLDEDESITDYIKGASARTQSGTSYVLLRLTNEGKRLISNWTASAEESAVTVFFYVGDTAIISLNVSEHINQKTLYISGGYDELAADAVAQIIDSSINAGSTELTLTLGDVVRNDASFGNSALILLVVALCVLFVGLAVFFFVLYRGLGLAHLYTSLIYLLLMIVFVWAIPFLHLGVETFVALALGLVLLAASNCITYENVKKEYALGKTMQSSVKAGYKRCFFQIFDLHIALALIAFVTYFIALTELAVFAFTLGLAVVLSGLCSLAVSRFHWAAFMSFAKDKGKFCNFKREEDDE